MKLVAMMSGGQDSLTALHWALREGHEITLALIFDYRQRHHVEIYLAKMNAAKANIDVSEYRIPMPAISSLTSQLVDEGGEVRNEFAEARGLPVSFTPGRNLSFFTYAAQFAALDGADGVLTGVCQTDEAGYPDCRLGFLDDMHFAIRSGFDWPEFKIKAPLMTLTKAETWALADELGVVDDVVTNTNTCYHGVRDELHAWGYGCGECGACVERRKGYDEWQQRLAVQS